MSSIVFTITQRLAYTANVSIQCKGNKIFENLRVIKFDRTDDATTTGNIPYGNASVTIVTCTSEFNQIVSAVNAMPAGGSVNVTLYYVDSGSGYLVSSAVVNGPLYRMRTTANPPAPVPSDDIAGATLAELQRLNQLLSEGLAALRTPTKPPRREMETNGEELDGQFGQAS